MSYVQIACVGLAAFAVSLAQGGTVAYWPMVMDPATGGTSRKVADASGNGYDLYVALDDGQVTNTSDVAFSCPPNGPSGVTAASCVETVNGTSLTTAPFKRGTGDKNNGQTTDPLILATGLRHDFTIEGYMYVKSLKHPASDPDTIIAFSGIDGRGDWLWNLTETSQNSNTRDVKVMIRGGGPTVDGDGILAKIADDEILGGWHHYALVFKFNEDGSKSRWSFYLDGVLRGSRTMNNHSESQNFQYDRFQLGGANSGAKKVFDSKLAFWRVSDEALPSDSLLCHQTFDTTVAYWSFCNITEILKNNNPTKIVVDAVDERNTLMIRDSSKGGVSWTANNIGWTTPPNPDADLTAAGVSCWSKMMVSSGNNTTKINDQYQPVFSTVTNAPVIEATKLSTNFTVEGFAKFTALPADSSKNQMFVYNTLGEAGGWCWNLYGTNANGNLAMKVSYGYGGSNRGTQTLCDSLRAEELLNVWNHYAISFTPDNGKGTTEWRFYLNGRLLGVNPYMPAYGDYGFTTPKFFLSGAPSGANPQALKADMTCWRVSNRVLAPTELLCGAETPVVPAGAFVWKGAADSAEWSTGSVPNWTSDGDPVAWTDAKDAYFDDTCTTNRIEITGTVTPASINVQADYFYRLDFSKDRSSAIGDGCTNFVKRGAGIFELYYDGSTMSLVNGAFPIEVREGCLRVNAANSNSALGDAARGYEVKVYDHAKLWLYTRNVIGSATPDVANDSVFTVYTNGTFDMSCSGSGFNIQALGTLDFLGGNFVAPRACHPLGYLLIRNRLTLGCSAGKRPYVFPDVPDQNADLACGITFGRNTEFRVEDVTGDAAADGIFNCAVLARTRDGWQNAQNPCGFRKTGGGTMELNNPYKGSSGTHGRPTGVIAVEVGELRVNVDYSLASRYTVADGAFLSGTGKVSKVEFAAGAGLRVDAGKADILELAGADFAGGGVIEIAGVPPEAIDNLRVNCAKVGAPVTGAENLSNWTVKADGVMVPGILVHLREGVLRASVLKGTCILFR